MCLIVECLKGRVLPLSVWKNFVKKNDDGAGFMWVDKQGRVKRARLLESNKSNDPTKIYLMHKTLAKEGIPHFVHLRYATHGVVSKDNCHPFEVLPGLMLMHNGVISPHSYNSYPNYSGMGEGRWLDEDMWPHLRERAGLRAPVTPAQEVLDAMVKDAVERLEDSMQSRPPVSPVSPAILLPPPGTTTTPVPPSEPTSPASPSGEPAGTPDAGTATSATSTAAPPAPAVNTHKYKEPVDSDTAIFVTNVLRPHLITWLETHTVAEMDAYLRSEGFNAQMKQWVGYGSRIVMYNKEGAVFFPDNHWVKLDNEKVPGAGGVFVSNAYAWTDEKDYGKNWRSKYNTQQESGRRRGVGRIVELRPATRGNDGRKLSDAEQRYLDNELQMLTLMTFFRSLADMEEVEREVVACPTEVAQLLMFLIDGTVPATTKEKDNASTQEVGQEGNGGAGASH